MPYYLDNWLFIPDFLFMTNLNQFWGMDNRESFLILDMKLIIHLPLAHVLRLHGASPPLHLYLHDMVLRHDNFIFTHKLIIIILRFNNNDSTVKVTVLNERIWKYFTTIILKAFSWHLPKDTKDNQRKLNQDSW